jgi:ribose transport system ATP-binding protein
MRLRDEPYRPARPTSAIARGVSMIPEDRRVHGAVMMHTVEQNTVLSILGRIAPWLYRPRVARTQVRKMIAELDIKTSGPQQVVGELSGGNQQKVVFARAMLAEPSLFLLDEPTFGVDVHTAAEIIRRMRAEVGGGKAAIWVSSDLTELVRVADRIVILADGHVRGIVRRGSPGFTEDALTMAIQPGEASASSGAAA